VVQDDGVFLEGALGGVVPCFLRAHGVPEDTVAHREPRHTGSDLDHLTGEIGAEDERVGDPSSDEASDSLGDPVVGVDRHGVVADDDLMLAGAWVGGGLDVQGSALGSDPGGGVG